MAKPSLAEKYAQHKTARYGSGTSSLSRASELHYRDTHRSIRDPSPLRPSYAELLRPKRDSKVPGLFDSPIRTLDSITRRTTRPLSLFKTQPESSPFRVTKSRPWAEKKSSSLFLLLGKFLTKFSLETRDDYKELRESANIPYAAKPRETHTVALQDLLQPKYRRDALDAEDLDEVDIRVQKAKLEREERRAKKERDELQKIIDEQRIEALEKKEKYERKLYLMEQDFEARTQQLREQIRDLTLRASFRSDQIALEKLEELQKAVLKDNESFLLHKRESELALSERTRELDRRAEELSRREAKLQSMLKTYEKEPPSSGIDADESATSLPQLVNRVQIRGHLERNMRDFEVEEDSLQQEERQVLRHVKNNEEDVIAFYDTIQSIMERILGKEEKLTPGEERLLQKVQSLVTSLEHSELKQEELAVKLSDYSDFFAKFDELFARDVALARTTYDPLILRKIEDGFAKLRKTLYARLAKRTASLSELDEKFDKIKVTRLNYSDQRVERVVELLNARTQQLLHQRRTVDLLKQLNELTRKLHNIQAILRNHR